MDSVTRKPEFEVRIVRPNFNSSYYIEDLIVASFSSNKENNGLLSYDFVDPIAASGGNFQLGLTLEQDDKGRTWLDRIDVKDLVFISEFDELRYVGTVEDKRQSSKMGGEGPERQISISGDSLSLLLSSFQLIIDQFLYTGTTTAQAANDELKEH